jgi:hypothetical protein
MATPMPPTDTLRFRIGNDLDWRASVPPHAIQVEV